MLKLVEIQHSSAQMIREANSPAQGLVMIDCQFAREEGNEEPLPVPLHWRVGDWSKPPIDIALEEETGRFQSLLLVLQDETIARKKLTDVDLTVLPSETGIPVFERAPWKKDETYLDEHFQPTLSWDEQSNLLVAFVLAPIQVTKLCLVDDTLTFFLNAQEEIIGFQLNHITNEEKRTIRWAAPT